MLAHLHQNVLPLPIGSFAYFVKKILGQLCSVNKTERFHFLSEQVVKYETEEGKCILQQVGAMCCAL